MSISTYQEHLSRMAFNAAKWVVYYRERAKVKHGRISLHWQQHDWDMSLYYEDQATKFANLLMNDLKMFGSAEEIIKMRNQIDAEIIRKNLIEQGVIKCGN